MALPGGTEFSDISRPADSSRFRRNSLPLAGSGTSGGSRRNCAHPSIGPAWTQVKLVPRTVLAFSIVRLLSGSGRVVNNLSRRETLAEGDQQPRRPLDANAAAQQG